MREKICNKAIEMFLKLGFKSVTMDDISFDLGISKKTIYKYFKTKEALIEEGTVIIHQNINCLMEKVISQNHNAIAENFQMREMFKDMFKSFDHSPAYQLKKHYPEIYHRTRTNIIEDCSAMFRLNIKKGISENLYRLDTDIEAAVQFYYTLIFSINENTLLEKDAYQLEIKALEYHTRAIATPKGIESLQILLKN